MKEISIMVWTDIDWIVDDVVKVADCGFGMIE